MVGMLLLTSIIEKIPAFKIADTELSQRWRIDLVRVFPSD